MWHGQLREDRSRRTAESAGDSKVIAAATLPMPHSIGKPSCPCNPAAEMKCKIGRAPTRELLRPPVIRKSLLRQLCPCHTRSEASLPMQSRGKMHGQLREDRSRRTAESAGDSKVIAAATLPMPHSIGKPACPCNPAGEMQC